MISTHGQVLSPIPSSHSSVVDSPFDKFAPIVFLQIETNLVSAGSTQSKQTLSGVQVPLPTHVTSAADTWPFKGLWKNKMY